MVPQNHSLTAHFFPSIFPIIHFSKPSYALPKSIGIAHFNQLKANQFRKCLIRSSRCSVSVSEERTLVEWAPDNIQRSLGDVTRTIMELSSVGTLSTLTQEGWPLGIGVRYAVEDDHGTPILCLSASDQKFFVDARCSLHVKTEHSGLRTPQCIIQGSLYKPTDRMTLKKLQSIWKNRLEEEVDENLLYTVEVERVLHIQDYMKEGMWVKELAYNRGNPDPLRNFAIDIVDEMNTHNMEDVLRFCSVYVDLDFKVSEAKMIWVDRLGFEVRLSSPQNDVFEVRIPFPREVTDEKSAKSSFNCMAQLAWEVEKNYCVPDFKKVNQLKKITSR